MLCPDCKNPRDHQESQPIVIEWGSLFKLELGPLTFLMEKEGEWTPRSKWRGFSSLGIAQEGEGMLSFTPDNIRSDSGGRTMQLERDLSDLGKVTCAIRSWCIFTTGHSCLGTLNCPSLMAKRGGALIFFKDVWFVFSQGQELSTPRKSQLSIRRLGYVWKGGLQYSGARLGFLFAPSERLEAFLLGEGWRELCMSGEWRESVESGFRGFLQ